MGNDIKIRKATLDDIDIIHQIEMNIFDNPFGKDMLQFEINENPFGNYFVLQLNDTIIGFIGFWYMYENGQITNVAISKEFQRNGYGELLIKHGIYDAKKNNVVNLTLEVRHNNLAAILLYEKLGFKKIGIRKNYYPGNIDAILMQKLM